MIVSYNHDLRGLIEDVFDKQRRVRCSLASFAHVADIVDGTSLLATVPTTIAGHALNVRPHLRTTKLPFDMPGRTGIEMLWAAATHDDPACRFAREEIVVIARRHAAEVKKRLT